MSRANCSSGAGLVTSHSRALWTAAKSSPSPRARNVPFQSLLSWVACAYLRQ